MNDTKNCLHRGTVGDNHETQDPFLGWIMLSNLIEEYYAALDLHWQTDALGSKWLHLY